MFFSIHFIGWSLAKCWFSFSQLSLLTRDSIKVKNGVHVLVGQTLFLILVIKESLLHKLLQLMKKIIIMHTAKYTELKQIKTFLYIYNNYDR